MFENVTWGIWSLLPLLVTLIIAFKTKSASFSLFIGCLVGAVMLGKDPVSGFNLLAKEALGNEDFIWLCEIIIFIGILFILLRKAGVVTAFAEKISKRVHTKKGLLFSSWALGLFVVDDYFAPLLRGVVMRPLTDKAKIPREKLAFILDSTTASVCVLLPFTAWGAYLASLIAAQNGPITSTDQSVAVFINSIPYNFYSILLILFTLGICLKLIPDFGPMKKAEKRALETGKVIRDGATPLTHLEADIEIESLGDEAEKKCYLIADLLIPILILLSVALGTFIFLGEIRIVEAFLTASLYLGTSLLIKRQIQNIQELMKLVVAGINDVLPAILIIALAYSINTVTKNLGAAEYIMQISKGWLTPSLLVAFTFLITATISFSTGTSWGAYALMVPFVLPLGYSFTNGQLDPLIYKCIAAVAGGGIFGDHASPVSDTSVLSSAGAGSDHMDHVVTQLPYALCVAAATFVLYLIF